MELKTIFAWLAIIVPILIGLWFQMKIIINFLNGNKKSLSNTLLICISAWSIAYVYVFISTISIGEWTESIEGNWSFMVKMLICCYCQAGRWALAAHYGWSKCRKRTLKCNSNKWKN